jgi:hypothetical protein
MSIFLILFNRLVVFLIFISLIFFYKIIIFIIFFINLFVISEYLKLFFKIFFLKKRCVINPPIIQERTDLVDYLITIFFFKPRLHIFLCIYLLCKKFLVKDNKLPINLFLYLKTFFWVIVTFFTGYSRLFIELFFFLLSICYFFLLMSNF